MSQETKIGNVEAVCLILTIMINHIIMNLPKVILEETGSGSILNILFITLIAIGTVCLISYFFKHFYGMDILDISEFLGGKILKYIIGILFMVYFLFSTSVFLRSFCESIKIIFFPSTPVMFLLLLFIIGIVLCNRLGMNPIIKANRIFIPIVLFTILFVFFANIENFTIQRIFPLLGNGAYTTFFSGLSNIFAFSGISLLYFLPPHLKDCKQFKKISIISIILSGIWLLISIITLLFIFPSMVITDEILPLYLASRFIEFGRFFQRLDAVFLLTCIISMMSYLSIVVASIIYIFKKICSTKYTYIGIYSCGLLVFLISLIPQNYAQIHFLETTIYKYIVIGLVFVISIILLTLATIKYKRQNLEKGEILIE